MALIPNQKVAMYGLSAQGTNVWSPILAGDSALLSVETRVARFDVAADMPVWSDTAATWLANVTADLCTFTTFTSTARRIQFIYHGVESGVTGTALAGPVASGAAVTVNAGDDATAASRLAFEDITGAGTSTSGYADLMILSPANPVVDVTLSDAITRIDAIGLANTLTVPTNIIPVLLEIRILG